MRPACCGQGFWAGQALPLQEAAYSLFHADLARKLKNLEKKYDVQFKMVFDAIRKLMAPPETKRRRIGFQVKEPEEGGLRDMRASFGMTVLLSGALALKV